MRVLAGSVLAMAAMPFVSADAVLAQGAGAACFEVIPARANIEPPVPIMIDKCTGRSWVLVRNGKSYRWAMIATDLERAKTADRAPVDGAAAAPDSGSQKCFTFNNRKFCE